MPYNADKNNLYWQIFKHRASCNTYISSAYRLHKQCYVEFAFSGIYCSHPEIIDPTLIIDRSYYKNG